MTDFLLEATLHSISVDKKDKRYIINRFLLPVWLLHYKITSYIQVYYRGVDRVKLALKIHVGLTGLTIHIADLQIVSPPCHKLLF